MHNGFSHAIGSGKVGRYSKYLPSQLDQLYAEAINNPELLEMADHIALLEAHIQETLHTAAQGDPVPRWSDVVGVFGEVETALLAGDMEKFVPGLERMHRVLDAGIKWDRTWKQVTEIMEQLRRMADTEIKRKKELNMMVPIERVIILMSAVGQAVKRNVKNPDEVQAVYRELAMLHGTDDIPGDPGQKRVGPEFIDVGPESRGIKGGGTERAKIHRRKIEQRKQEQMVASGGVG